MKSAQPVKEPNPGFAGSLARNFLHSHLTPIIAVASLVLGIASVYLTPKEEEPQISVPMIDIRTNLPGYEAHEVEQKVTEVIEKAVWGLEGVEYVYSASSPHSSLVTVRFKVGEPVEPSLVKVHHKIMEIRSSLPQEASQPLVKSYSIDDVPFLVLTFQSSTRDDFSLRSVVSPLARDLAGTPDISRVDIYGGRKQSIRVVVDPARSSAAGVSILDVAHALKANHEGVLSGKNWGKDNVVSVEAGGLLSTAQDVARTGVGQRAGLVVRVGDVATVTDGPEERSRLSYVMDHTGKSNAVSLSFAKRKGTNAAELSVDVMKRAERFASTLPSDIHMTVMRNYGQSAKDKSSELIEHLIIATISVGVLIAITMGLRASAVVSLTIPVTLALTLGIYYFMGYTLNRVTLFALIFSIGILVDDAIVVVENVERHLRESPHLSAAQATLRAVAEVGNPTILATFTVIAAILPMMFVRGLMGPYMKPIPVGASFAMILSLLVAFIVTPWAAVRLLKKHTHSETKASKLDALYDKVMRTLLSKKKSALVFGGVTVFLLLASMGLIASKAVKVKMLPFDNKNEFQVLLDYPASTPLEKSSAESVLLAQELLKHPDVERVQIFAGESAPYSFSGLVKHTFLRAQDYKTDLQVVLKDIDHRKKKSHEIIEEIRPRIADFARAHNALSKVLEIPPGPPVMATLVAEVYGPDNLSREKAARTVQQIFAAEKSVVDLDYSWRPERDRRVYNFNVNGGALLGINASDASQASLLTFSETPIVSLAESNSPEIKTVDLSLAQSARSGASPFRGQTIATREAGTANLDQVFGNPQIKTFETLHRKNLKPVSYVVSELSGAEEAPVYGIMSLGPKIPFQLQTVDVPWNMDQPVVKWDGEWYITYEVFRDLGLAFAAVLVLIYVLVTGWFKSYAVPLVIMAPIPISLIGILPGHAAFGAYFTATSMIGFIAGAGIIVRNSIILVDFIEHQIEEGAELKEAVIQAGITRFRPMLLTAAAVVVGTAVILFDPIFQGLALSLMFGEVAATLISRIAVPVLYHWFIGKSRAAIRA
ncbi:MAG TPA: efflux RND transporter permease subunit [Leptospiraceae bacterium]|nr:efflux RND transporter permease subunit [Leptospiraceae bacterium]